MTCNTPNPPIMHYLKPLLFYQKENITEMVIQVLITFWTISAFTYNELMKLRAKEKEIMAQSDTDIKIKEAEKCSGLVNNLLTQATISLGQHM